MTPVPACDSGGQETSYDEGEPMTTETTQEAAPIAVTPRDLIEALDQFYLTVRGNCGDRHKGQVADPAQVAGALYATLSRIAAERAPDDDDRDELTRLRNGGRELGRITARLYRSMRAASIEMAQNGPEAGMQWVLNSIPPPVDEGDGELWDGTETAQEWFDRVEAADRAAEAEAAK